MKRKTLVILLIIPFLLGILSFVTVTILTRAVAVDISDISWNYRQNAYLPVLQAQAFHPAPGPFGIYPFPLMGQYPACRL